MGQMGALLLDFDCMSTHLNICLLPIHVCMYKYVLRTFPCSLLLRCCLAQK